MPNYTVVDEARDLIKPYVDTGDSAQESLTRSTVGWTGKNLYNLDNTTKNETGTCAFVYTANKTVTVSGAAGSVKSTVHLDFPTENGKKYRFTGCPSGGSTSTYRCDVYNVGMDTGDGIEFTGTGSTQSIDLVIAANYTIDGTVTFSPMITDAAIKDRTFEPYHESVEVEFEEEIHGVNLLKMNLADIKSVNTGGTWNNNVYSVNNLTFTFNDDKTVTVNGTASAVTYVSVFGIYQNDLLPQGDYILNGGIAGGGSGTYSLYVHERNADNTNWVSPAYNDYDGKGVLYSRRNNNHYGILIFIASGKTVSNLVFKPMIRKAEIEDNTFRKYNPQSIQNQINDKGVLGAKNLLPFNCTTRVVGKVTFTVDSTNNIVTATSDGQSTGAMVEIGRMLCKAGVHYKLRGVNNNTTNVSERKMNLRVGKLASETESGFGVYDPTATYDGIMNVYGNRTGDILYSTDQWITVDMEILSGTTLTNFVVKPQISLMSDPDDTYVPYAMTNRELTEAKTISGVSVSVTSGSVSFISNSATCKRCGQIVQIEFGVKATAQLAEGSSIQVSMSGAPKPLQDAGLTGYIGSASVIGLYRTNKNVDLRIVGAAINQDGNIYVRGTYIAGE